jgi:hypothetical protein
MVLISCFGDTDILSCGTSIKRRIQIACNEKRTVTFRSTNGTYRDKRAHRTAVHHLQLVMDPELPPSGRFEAGQLACATASALNCWMKDASHTLFCG